MVVLLVIDGGFTMRVLGFGRDADGEPYVLANQTRTPFGATGAVLKIEAASEEVPIGY